MVQDEQNSAETSEPPDTQAGDMVLIQAAAQLLKGATETRDPRVATHAASIIETLKQGNILETLLIALAQQQDQTVPQIPGMTIGAAALLTKNQMISDNAQRLSQLMGKS